jgi:monoamine oxidase
MSARMSRRDLIKTGALATAGVGGMLAGAIESAAARGQTVQTDYVIVGAGYAGLGAAWELFKQGKRVFVIDTNDRVGGRVWSSKLSDGTLFEIGGQWVSDSQTDIRTLMKELGVENKVYQTFDEGRVVFVDTDGTRGSYDPSSPDPLDRLPPIDPAAKAEVAVTFLTFQAMASVVNVSAPWENHPFPEIPGLLGPQTTVEADQWTVESWLELNLVDDTAKAIVRSSVAGFSGLNTGAISLLHWLFCLQTFGGNFQDITGTGSGQAEQLRVAAPGAQQMALLIADKIGPASFLLGQRVTQIEQDDSGATVTTASGLSVRGRRVIVSIPATLTGSIHYVPALPPDRAQLQQRVPLGTVWKIWLVYDRAYWRERNPPLTGESVSIQRGDFIPNARDGGGPAGQNAPGLMICFVVGDSARAFNALTREARKAEVLREMVHRFGPEAAQLSPTIRFPAVPPQNPAPDNYFEFNWAIDEFSRGDFGAILPPAVQTGVGFGPALRQPVGRIHWAGLDTATTQYGSFSAALGTGKRAAAEALAAG